MRINLTKNNFVNKQNTNKTYSTMPASRLSFTKDSVSFGTKPEEVIRSQQELIEALRRSIEAHVETTRFLNEEIKAKDELLKIREEAINQLEQLLEKSGQLDKEHLRQFEEADAKHLEVAKELIGQMQESFRKQEAKIEADVADRENLILQQQSYISVLEERLKK